MAKAATQRPALEGTFLALGVSRPFGACRHDFDAVRWAAFCRDALAAGHRLVVVRAQGSRTPNPYADLLPRAPASRDS